MRAVVRPLQAFVSTEAAGGIVLLLAAGAALVWVNAPFGGTYGDTWSQPLTLGVGRAAIELTLVGWVNDALMALFFFVVGMEIKRELLAGELSEPRKAMLPIAAALGGMIVPALIYALFNAGGDAAWGWGIPMATDIAFAVGVLSLLGRRVPTSLKVFLLALAIVDDLGAIAVIAVFYSDGLALGWFAAATGAFAAVYVLGRAGIIHLGLYIVLGVFAWIAVYESGVHATIAGAAMGLLMPASSGAAADAGGPAPSMVIDRVEAALHPWTSFAVIPLFALANAGVELGGGAVRDAATSPVAAGVALGLLVGKPAGITLAAFVAVRVGVASLPAGVRWRDLAAVSMVAGIGFTVSLFISALAFTDAAFVAEAKMAILAGSAMSGVAGLVALWLSLSSRAESDAAMTT